MTRHAQPQPILRAISCSGGCFALPAERRCCLCALSFKIFASYLPTDEAGQAQDRFIDEVLSGGGSVLRRERVNPNVFVLEGHASVPHYG